MNNVNFLGVGSAFNYQEDCTSCYFINKKTIFFIDMGEKIASKIITSGLLDFDFNKVVILITHMHADHIGSLEPFITYLKIFKKIEDVIIVYPNSKELEEYLKLSYLTQKVNYVSDTNTKIDGITIEAVEQKHIINSYGFFIKEPNYSFFYSGDTSLINKQAIELLISEKIDAIYHEVADKTNLFHTGIDDLNNSIPQNIRNKVYLMHFSSDELKEKVKSYGYQIPLVK